MTDGRDGRPIRGPAALTIRILQAGGAFATALFLSAIVLQVLGSDVAERAAVLGVLAIIATPPLSLAATAVETWGKDRHVALLAAVVLAVLAVATGVALFLGH
jgi:hypothetical protein